MRDLVLAGVLGAAGYTGGELLRLLVYHPYVDVAWAVSKSQAGKSWSAVHPDLSDTDNFLADMPQNAGSVDVIFLCLNHGESAEWIAANPLPESCLVIDLSQDFRLDRKEWIYGLSEVFLTEIKTAKRIANPGCFATAIQLALAPLAANQLIHHPVHINATTGSTGAGQKPTDTSHFSWREGNFSTYKVFTHQHEAEVHRTLEQLGNDVDFFFVPNRGNFTRGIFATIYTAYSGDISQALALFQGFYQNAAFVSVTNKPIDLKQVVNTNRALLQVQVLKGQIVIQIAIDNLLKGASGQAVQNMNLVFGFEQTAGLLLKPSVY